MKGWTFTTRARNVKTFTPATRADGTRGAWRSMYEPFKNIVSEGRLSFSGFINKKNRGHSSFKNAAPLLFEKRAQTPILFVVLLGPFLELL